LLRAKTDGSYGNRHEGFQSFADCLADCIAYVPWYIQE